MTLFISDVRKQRSVVDALRCHPFEFDLVDYDTDDSWIEFRPEIDFTVVAGDSCGGVFLICDETEQNKGIFHISSDAKASRIGSNLREALEHILAMPNWPDLAHEDLGTMRHRADEAREIDDGKWHIVRDRVASKLKLDVTSDHTERLHTSLAAGISTMVLANETPTINGFASNWDQLAP